MKPLFIPLRREHFEAFVTGEKTFEYRQWGPRWNERTCFPGRSVILSLGYGKRHRITGKIVSFTKCAIHESRCGSLFQEIYGRDATGPVAEIEIEVDK